MKRNAVYMMVAVLILALALSACGGGTDGSPGNEAGKASSAVGTTSSNDDSESGAGEGVGEDFRDAMPISAQLGFGTLMLEGSENAVDREQAAQLLPLWKAARSLSESETVAQTELEAVFSQIEETMTSEQIKAINAMQLTGEEMAQLMEDLGIEVGFGGGFGNLTPEMQATARESGEGLPGGGFPGGGFPGGNPGGPGPGGGQGFGGGNLTPEQRATMEARRPERGDFGARFALVFVDPLIELLEERAAE